MEFQKEKNKFKPINFIEEKDTPFYKKNILNLKVIDFISLGFIFWTCMGIYSLFSALDNHIKYSKKDTLHGINYYEQVNSFIKKKDYNAAILEMNKMIGVNNHIVDIIIIGQATIIKSQNSHYNQQLDKLISNIKDENRRKFNTYFISNTYSDNYYNPLVYYFRQDIANSQIKYNQYLYDKIDTDIKKYENMSVIQN